MANPFGNMKELYKMQREAKQMQKKLREKKVKGVSKNGYVTIYMNAAQEFEDIEIADHLLSPSMHEELRSGFKSAFKDYQKKLQKEMMKDMDLDQIKGMLGG